MKKLFIALILMIFILACGSDSKDRNSKVNDSLDDDSVIQTRIEKDDGIMEKEENDKVIRKISNPWGKDEDTYEFSKDKIVESTRDGKKEILKFNLEKGQEIQITDDNPYLDSDNRIIFFDYFAAANDYRLNGIDVESQELIFDESQKVGGGAEVFWSPEKDKAAFVWNLYDGLFIKIADKDAQWELQTLVGSVYYPSDSKNTKYEWKDNQTFVFYPDKEYLDVYKESFKEKGLDVEKNEFAVE